MIRKPKKTTKYKRRERDFGYMAWIRAQPCVVCGTRRNIEAAHVGARGFGVKCDDTETLPMCHEDHQEGKKSHHGWHSQNGETFWEFWRLDKEKLIAKHRKAYAEYCELINSEKEVASEPGNGTAV